jgi:hypothetical protein
MVTVPVEERFAIQELSALYSLYCDTRQPEKTAQLFTEICNYDESAVGLKPATSRADVQKILQKSLKFVGPTKHICPAAVISAFTGATARGVCYVLAEGLISIDGAEAPFRIRGYYDDRYEKTDGRWYFTSRVLRLLVPSIGVPTHGGITYDTHATHFAIR